ncbi:Acyl carrier protein [Minicystis rosea]|nr:Acyl carrier protein [Minicystis rosea]
MALSKDDIERWLVERIAASMRVSPAEVPREEPFTELGLDSVDAVSLVSELREWVGLELPVTLFYEQPNIVALSQHLAAQRNA